MRLKRNRLVELKHCPLEQKKDNEGGTYIEYGSAVPFRAEMWAAGGRIQTEMYGPRLPNIRNLRIDGAYTAHTRSSPGRTENSRMRWRTDRQFP